MSMAESVIGVFVLKTGDTKDVPTASLKKHNEEVMKILAAAKRLAQRYRDLTGKPLGITGEVAEFEAARLLKLELVGARQEGFDAIRMENGVPHRLEIKGRCLLPGHGPGQRMGQIDTEQEFDGVLLVLMDECFNAKAIYEADRKPIIKALKAPGSISRNERGQLSVNKFKAIGRRVWPVERNVRKAG